MKNNVRHGDISLHSVEKTEGEVIKHNGSFVLAEMAIEDIDQRTQAMRFGDVNKFIEHTKSTLLDESKSGNKLYKIPKEAGIFTVDAYYLVYSCPSTAKVYMSGFPKEIGETKDADGSMAWKHNLSKEAYQLLNNEA